jgi:Skp family chaperone for outer membrane proteins
MFKGLWKYRKVVSKLLGALREYMKASKKKFPDNEKLGKSAREEKDLQDHKDRVSGYKRYQEKYNKNADVFRP